SGDDLTLHSTSHGTKGTIFFGANSAYDQVNDRLSIGATSSTLKLDVKVADDTAGVGFRIYNSDGSVVFENITGNVNEFCPRMTGNSAGAACFTSIIGNAATGDDSGSEPILQFGARVNDGSVSVRPLFAISNYTLDVITVDKDGNLTLVGDQAVQGGDITLGVNGADGKVVLYSEQGGTDYSAGINPNAAMTSAAEFYLPADEPGGTYLLNMTTGGVIGYDATAYEPALSKGNLTETTSAILTITGGTGAVIGSGATIEVQVAATGTPGYVTGADWDTFNGKQDTISVDSDYFTLSGVTVEFSTNYENAAHWLNGFVVETIGVTVTEATGTVSLNLEQSGSGDLTFFFSDGWYALDCTPTAAAVVLTAGTDIAPTLNYVYLLQSNKTLTASTVGWPATEHAAVATVLVQSAAGVATDEVYKLHAWTDHATDVNSQGHLTDINKWIRQQHATWVSGAAPSFSGDGTGTIGLATTAGVVYQLHPHTFPVFNDPAT
ncbi:unnamed protein product, partial [marine sediment metagenome]